MMFQRLFVSTFSTYCLLANRAHASSKVDVGDQLTMGRNHPQMIRSQCTGCSLGRWMKKNGFTDATDEVRNRFLHYRIVNRPANKKKRNLRDVDVGVLAKMKGFEGYCRTCRNNVSEGQRCPKHPQADVIDRWLNAEVLEVNDYCPECKDAPKSAEPCQTCNGLNCSYNVRWGTTLTRECNGCYGTGIKGEKARMDEYDPGLYGPKMGLEDHRPYDSPYNGIRGRCTSCNGAGWGKSRFHATCKYCDGNGLIGSGCCFGCSKCEICDGTGSFEGRNDPEFPCGRIKGIRSTRDYSEKWQELTFERYVPPRTCRQCNDTGMLYKAKVPCRECAGDGLPCKACMNTGTKI